MLRFKLGTLKILAVFAVSVAILILYFYFSEPTIEQHNYEASLASLLSGATPDEQDKILFVINYKYIKFIDKYQGIAFQSQIYGRPPEFISLISGMSKKDFLNNHVQVEQEIDLADKVNQEMRIKKKEMYIKKEEILLEIANKKESIKENEQKIKSLQHEKEILEEVLPPDEISVEFGTPKYSKKRSYESEELIVPITIKNVQKNK